MASNHRKPYGDLGAFTLSPATASSTQPTGPGNTVLPSTRLPETRSERTGGRGEAVIKLVDSLDIKYGFERSCKMAENSLLANRFLLGFKKKRIRHDAHGRILEICKQLEMPEALLRTYSEKLPDANYLHFGVEESEKNCIFKAYLEFYEKFEEENNNKPGPPGPFLMHLGYKWDARNHSRQAVTNYVWLPMLSIRDIGVRLSGILPPEKFGTIYGIATGIVSFASRIIHPFDILYLEVTEENNPRRSFDINMYRANLRMDALYPFLAEICRHYGIAIEKFHTMYDGIKTRRFGHISGGIDREGKDFLTVYYGVEYTEAPNPNDSSASP